MKFRNKLTTLIVIMILANTTLVPLALAQTPPATTTATSTDRIGYKDFKAANAGPEACAALGVRIKKFLQPLGNYTTKYSTTWAGSYVTPAAGETNDTNSGFGQCNLAERNKDGSAGKILNNDWESILSAAGKVDASGTPEPLTQAEFVNAVNGTDPEMALWGTIVGYILSTGAKVISSAAGGLAMLAGYILSKVVSLIGLPPPPIVTDGWVIIRDLMNMVFVLILIIMSIATILRVEAYNYRKMLLQLVLMALLINFSKVIADNLIYAFDLVTRAIAGSGDFFSYSQFFNEIVKIKANESAGFFANAGSQAVQSLTQMVYAIVATVVFVAISALLFVRLVGLWFLTMISPIAYAMNILPQTKTYAKQWWDTFIKYLIWAPVSILFLQLGNKLMYARSQSSFSGDKTLDFLFITAFMWGGFVMAKRAGMYGSGAILKYAESAARGGSKMTAKFVARGGPQAAVGDRLQKKGWIKEGTNNRTFGLWKKAAQKAEAFPVAAKEGFKKLDENYNKGVGEEKKKMLYRTGYLDDKEMLKNSKDAERLFTDKLASPKFSVSDMHDLVNDTPRKALPGVIEALRKAKDPDMKKEANIALLKKLDERNAAPGTDLLNELGGPVKPGESGFRYVNPEDHSKGMYLEYFRENRNTHEVDNKPQTRRFNANPKATELDVMTPENRKEADAKYEKYKIDIQKTTDHIKALQNDPNAESKILESSTKGEILSQPQLRAAKEFVDAYEGAGATTEVPKSTVTNTGKVILNSEAAEALGIAKDQDRYFPADQLSELKDALVKHGGVSSTDLQKLETAIKNLPGIQAQRGIYKPLAPIMREQLGAEGVKNLRAAQGQEKEHEGIHRFSDFIRQANKQMYQEMASKIINFDKAKFEELKKEIQTIPEYSKLTNDVDIAEEIMAEAKYRNRLDSDLLKQINQSVQGLQREYAKSIFTTARTNKFAARSESLAQRIAKRNPELDQANTLITRRI